jgi:hypothetical protein
VSDLATLLVALTAPLVRGAGGPPDGVALSVSRIDVDVPLETRIGASGIAASLPRGLLATGFDYPRGRLRLRIDAAEAP